MSSPEPPPDARDLPLNDEDRNRLQDELARIYDTPDSVVRLLDQIGFPRELIPIFRTPEGFWSKVFTELDRGAIAVPYRRMLAATLGHHGSYRTLTDLARRYEVAIPPLDADRGDAMPGSKAMATCHVIVQASSPDERDEARRWLAALGFEPRQVWSNLEAVSYRLNEAAESLVRERLRERPDLRCTLVSPGEPDYLIDELRIQDDEGRELAIRDLPSHQKLSELAASIVRQHPAAHLNVRRLGGATYAGPGRRRRVNPDRTLAQEGLRDGDQVEMGTLRAGPVKVFLIGASPSDLGPVRAEKEAKAILDAAQLGHLELGECQATQARDLPKLRIFQPDILHFACHSESGQIILEDHEGLSHPVPATTIARMLRHHATNGSIRLSGIVLACCGGEDVAPAFEGAADTIIAHKKKLDDNCALLFTRYFYEELSRTPELYEAAPTAALDVPSEASSCEMIVENLIVIRSPRTQGGR